MGSTKGRTTFRYTAAAAAGLLTLAVMAPAMAQPKPTTTATPAAKPRKALTEAQKKDAAKNAYKSAEERFAAGDYAAAVLLYREADEHVPGAMPKFKAGLSLDKLNRAPEAIDAYQKFIDFKPDPEKFKDKLVEAKARQEAIRKTPARVTVALTPAVPGAKFEVDGVAQPPGNEVAVPPGKHKVTARAPGYEPATQEIDVTFAEKRDISLTLTKSTAPVAVVAPPPTSPTPSTLPPTKAPPPSEPRSNVPAYVTIGLAGAGVIVGTIFGVQALSAKSDFEESPTQENFDDAERSALLADMSYGVALTFGVTGIVLLLSNDSEPAKTTAGAQKKPSVARPFLTPYAGPQGGGAVGTIQF